MNVPRNRQPAFPAFDVAPVPLTILNVVDKAALLLKFISGSTKLSNLTCYRYALY